MTCPLLITKMLIHVYLILNIFAAGHSLLILDKLAAIKDKIVSKVLGDSNCGCPCREYNVIKCDVQWVEHCYQEHKLSTSSKHLL